MDLSVPLSTMWAHLKPQLVEVVVAEEQEVALWAPMGTPVHDLRCPSTQPTLGSSTVSHLPSPAAPVAGGAVSR